MTQLELQPPRTPGGAPPRRATPWSCPSWCTSAHHERTPLSGGDHHLSRATTVHLALDADLDDHVDVMAAIFEDEAGELDPAAAVVVHLPVTALWLAFTASAAQHLAAAVTAAGIVAATTTTAVSAYGTGEHAPSCPPWCAGHDGWIGSDQHTAQPVSVELLDVDLQEGSVNVMAAMFEDELGQLDPPAVVVHLPLTGIWLPFTTAAAQELAAAVTAAAAIAGP